MEVRLYQFIVVNEGFLYFVNEGFLYFVNEGFLYFVNEGFLCFVNEGFLYFVDKGFLYFVNEGLLCFVNEGFLYFVNEGFLYIFLMKDFQPSCNEVAVGLCFGERRAGVYQPIFVNAKFILIYCFFSCKIMGFFLQKKYIF